MSDLSRIQELYSVVTQTQAQLRELSFTREQFAVPQGTLDDLIAEGIINRIFRALEEAGSISAEFTVFGTRPAI